MTDTQGVDADPLRLSRRRVLQGIGAVGAAGALAALPVAAGGRPSVAVAATRRWSDPASWPDGRVPGAGDRAVVTGTILLDRDARVAGVSVERGAALVFAPEQTRTLESTGNVVVHGRLVMRPASAAQRHLLRFLGIDESAFAGGDAASSGAHALRLAGATRFETAAAISANAFRQGARRVFVATGLDFPDALVAGAAGAHREAPVLLTARDTLPDATEAEIRRLDPRDVVVVGGGRVVSDAVVQRLKAVAGGADVRRVSGETRYATAAAVARDAFRSPVPVAFVATGENYPDALSGGVSAGRLGGPLLLTAPGSLPAVTAEALGALEPGRIVVLGGERAVAPAVADRLQSLTRGPVERIAGDTRFGTAAAVARHAYPGRADTVYLATGTNFPDALAGTPAAVAEDGPLLLCSRDGLPDEAAGELRRLRPRNLVVLGGGAAVSAAVATHAAFAAAGGTGQPHADVPERDVGLWVVGEGALDVRGTPRAGWNRTGTSTTWRDGDEIRVAPHRRGDHDGFARFTPGAAVPSVASGGVTYRTEVLNLTRNVRIEGTPGRRAHVFVRSTSPQTIRHVAIRHVGPRQDDPDSDWTTDVTGRYGLHFHHCGDATRGILVEGVVVRDCGAHAFVSHASHGITFRDCIAYKTVDEAYWWDRDDIDSYPVNASHDVSYVHCASFANVDNPETRNFRMGGFELGQGTGNRCVDCVVAGGSRNGFVWLPHSARIPNTWLFKDCVAHNVASDGIFVWQNGHVEAHLLQDFVAYRCKRSGVNHGAYRNRYDYARVNVFECGWGVDSNANGFQTWSDVRVADCDVGLRISSHNLPPLEEIVMRDWRFERVGVAVRVEESVGAQPGRYDLVRPRVDGRAPQPSDFDVVTMHAESVIRVQRPDGSAFRVTAEGVEPIPAFG